MSHQNSKGPKAFVHPYGPEITIKDAVDTMPSDYQPPGVDNKDRVDYNSLEEALTS